MRLPVIIINDCWEYIIEVEESEEQGSRDPFQTLVKPYR